MSKIHLWVTATCRAGSRRSCAGRPSASRSSRDVWRRIERVLGVHRARARHSSDSAVDDVVPPEVASVAPRHLVAGAADDDERARLRGAASAAASAFASDGTLPPLRQPSSCGDRATLAPAVVDAARRATRPRSRRRRRRAARRCARRRASRSAAPGPSPM